MEQTIKIRKFKPKDIVKMYGSEGQLLCYGIIDYEDKDLPNFPYYPVVILKGAIPRIVNDEHLLGYGTIPARENELKLVEIGEPLELERNFWE